MPSELPWRLGQRAIAVALLLLVLILFISLASELRVRGGLGSLPESANAALDFTIEFLHQLFSGELALGEEWRAALSKSLGLILLSTSCGVAAGLLLGTIAAIRRHDRISALLIGGSVLGVSTPSYIVGMLFVWGVVDIYQRTNIRLLPTFGFGWDEHLIMPVLTLAMRPMTNMLRMSFSTLTEVLGADFVRTAHSKGLPAKLVYWRHVLRNAGVPLMTAAAVSLRSTLSVLPIVEIIFAWPGIGMALLQARDTITTVSLVLPLAVLFVMANYLLEMVYLFVDPRVGSGEQEMR